MLSGNEGLVVLAVIALLFGSTQIPKLARNLGRAQKEFKQGIAEGQAESDEDAKGSSDPAKSSTD